MNNEQTVPVPLTGDDYYGEGKCHVCQNDIAIKVNGRFYDKIVGDLVTGFNNGFKAARKLNANHAALVEALNDMTEAETQYLIAVTRGTEGRRPPSECEHDWGPVWPGPGQDDWDYECIHCNQTRAVADFWKREPPSSGHFYWFRRDFIEEIQKWSHPYPVYKHKATRQIYQHWHGPIETRNGRILPPPTPDSKLTP